MHGGWCWEISFPTKTHGEKSMKNRQKPLRNETAETADASAAAAAREAAAAAAMPVAAVTAPVVAEVAMVVAAVELAFTCRSDGDFKWLVLRAKCCVLSLYFFRSRPTGGRLHRCSKIRGLLEELLGS